ncbi:Taurine catabolism dioxygenase TauD/TfdA [Moelleriella libera RCEF 2490]|uniref:Taurine catabolism dioxygenase TauD/TfdA n=1 Tax=Moelleriella libera RCEF 2490 TaxID=1081109 RepID=A0A166PAT3_9HYPO|nr:Taurine catabolism dioxygenase TauD/TfdA [Moelleriella libera RCEF 2490]
MAPATVDSSYTELPLLQQAKSNTASAAGSFPKPLQTTGALDRLEHFDVTPAIGREYPHASIVDILNAENSDELLRELAITISQRGVVFFRAQDGLTNELQKELILHLGRLTGRPASSGLHIHPILNSERDLGGEDPEISTISSVQHDKFYPKKGHEDGGHKQEEEWGEPSPKKQSTAQWHSDIAFEKVPADYTSLRLMQLPKTGGDTLWASGYEIYDRISAPYQAFLESLTATFAQPNFAAVAEKQGFQLYDKPRGAPENVGRDLKAVHPVVRTNPVTGWKSIFPVGGHVSHINGVTDEESSSLLRWFLDLVYRNHDLQVRFKWQNPNDIAIWDNRSVFHTATFDYRDQGDRFGNRVVGLGERPFLDPQSTSRRAALGLDN